MKRYIKVVSIVIAAAILMSSAGCAMVAKEPAEGGAAESITRQTAADASGFGTAALLSASVPKASGSRIAGNDSVIIDYSNARNGYMMVKYTGSQKDYIRVMVTNQSDGIDYLYTLKNRGKYETFPFSQGNGTYSVKVYKRISGNKYSTVFTTDISVKLKNQFAPFLMTNQFVNYTKNTKCIKKAKTLVRRKKSELAKIEAIYNWVVKYYKYDKKKAKNVQSGYLPDLNKVYKSRRGICFDYAATMTAMLRSQKIPCKLVIGYVGSAYHAWINVYTKKSGWIDGAIYFNGKKWKLMDPTFASTARSRGNKKFVGDGRNYQQKFAY